MHVQVEQALDLLGLNEVSRFNPRDLGYSGRKRVSLASAIAMQTPGVVFDEPTAGLDSKEQAQLSRVISFLHQEGKTVLVISHDMDFLAENFERFVLLKGGQVILDAPVQHFFEQGQLLKTSGLVAPQITRLSQRMGHAQLAAHVEQFLDNQGLQVG